MTDTLDQIISLDSVLAIREVSVVQSIDAAALRALLSQLLNVSRQVEDRSNRQQQDIDELKSKLSSQDEGSRTVKPNDASTSVPASKGTEAKSAHHQTAVGPTTQNAQQDQTPLAIQDDLVALEARVARLEAAAARSAPTAAAVTQAPSTEGAAPTAGTAVAPSEPFAEGDAQAVLPGNALSEQFNRLAQQNGHLADQLADLQAALAVAKQELAEQLVRELGGKADANALQALGDQLGNMAGSRELERLRQQVQAKADRSELDALLISMAGGGPSSGQQEGAGSAGRDNTASSTAADASTAVVRVPQQEGVTDAHAVQLTKLQLQWTLLQERINQKADVAALQDMSDSLGSHKGQLQQVQQALQELQSKVQAVNMQPNSIKGAVAPPAVSTTACSIMPSAGLAVSASGDLLKAQADSTAQQLQQLHLHLQQELSLVMLRLSALEESAAAAAIAAATVPDDADGAGASDTLHCNANNEPGRTSDSNSEHDSSKDHNNSRKDTTAHSEQQWDFPTKPPRQSALSTGVGTQHGFEGDNGGAISASAFKELRGKVAALAAQMARLAQQVSAASANSGINNSGLPTAAGTASITATSTPQQVSTAAVPMAPRMSFSVNSHTAAGANTAANAGQNDEQASTAAAAALEGCTQEWVMELSPELVRFRAAMMALGDSKADRSELQQLRAMLGDTATQKDVDVLAHKLQAQQSQLQCLAQQVEGIGGVSTSSSTGSAKDSLGTAPSACTQPDTSGAHTAKGMNMPAGAVAGARRSPDGLGGRENIGSGHSQDAGGFSGHDMDGWQVQMQDVIAQLEQVAQAVCLLATGQAATATPSAATTAAAAGTNAYDGSMQKQVAGAGQADGTAALSFPDHIKQHGAAPSAATGGSSGINADAGIVAGAGSGGRGSSADAGGQGLCSTELPEHGPNMDRLKTLMQTGQVGRKMNWFDPTVLQKMAQRLAAAEALIKAPLAGGAAATVGGDIEAKLKKLAAEVKMLKERMGDSGAAVASSRPGGLQAANWRPGDGDHTMLAAKPLAGYKCIACDRPLGTLDVNPGPYLPTGQMPVSLPTAAELTSATAQAKQLPPAGVHIHRATVQGPAQAAAGAEAGTAATGDRSGKPGDPTNRRATGPQNWYAAAHGPPADQLPKADVGPHLPPGGWRGTQPLTRGEDGASVLPALGPRGGSTAP